MKTRIILLAGAAAVYIGYRPRRVLRFFQPSQPVVCVSTDLKNITQKSFGAQV